MQDIIDKIQTLQNEYITMKENFCVTMRNSMKQFFVEFFKENPSINAVIWTQYTPYFNDGDACEFSVNGPCFTNALGEDLNDISPWGEYDGENDNLWVFHSYDDIDPDLKINKRSIEFLDIMLQSENMSEIMLKTFGDHSKVIATSDGFEIEEYEHD